MTDLNIKQVNPVVTEVKMKYKAGFEQWFLLTADHHWDNPKCDLDLLKRHHNEALERNAGIFCFGDLFCAMQGKYDKRSSKSDLRPEHTKGNYLDTLVTTAANWYSPFSKNYIVVSEGNHETAILRRHETDICQRMVDLTNSNSKSNIIKGLYSGYIVFRFEHESGGSRSNYKISFNHGYGGGGPVTKGVIQSNRKAVYIPDADLVVSGHVHERWILEIPKERLDANLTPYIHTQTHLTLGTYKEEYLPHKGFHIEKGRPPKPLGGAWLRFYYKNGIKSEIVFTD